MPLFNTTYHIITPAKTSGFFIDWEYCLMNLVSLYQREERRIVKINIFLFDPDPIVYQQKREYVRKDILALFEDQCPTFGIIAQAPEEASVALEIGTVKSEGLNIRYRKYRDHPYTFLTKNNTEVLYANGLEDFHSNQDTESGAKGAFEKALEILSAENMTFDHVVRQWNYVGNILHQKNHDGLLLQHYQLFNEIRNQYYSKYRTPGNYPAATGIGAHFNGMSIDICAVKSSDKIKVSAINSPIQVEPYHYSQKVLVGPANNHKTAPQFERAKIMMNEKHSTIYISGTASIIGQQTIGIDDIQEQTKNTIENIESLVSLKNLQSHSLFPQDVVLEKEYRYIRVYVKYLGDIPLVRKICKSSFGDTPAIYVQSDICREDLLVEIEGELRLSLPNKY